MLTIALIEENTMVRLGLSCLLRDNFDGISLLVSDSRESFYKTFPNAAPNLVILGFTHRTGDNSLDASRQILLYHNLGIIIVLDEDPHPDVIMSYLKANVKGYISKRKHPSEIVACIKMVLEGKRYIGNDTVKQLIEHFTFKSEGTGGNQDYIF